MNVLPKWDGQPGFALRWNTLNKENEAILAKQRGVENKKQYVIANKEKISAQGKVYYEANKDVILSKRISRYHDNIEESHIKNKECYQNNLIQIKLNKSIRITCECGKEMTKGAKSNHILKSQHHLNYINAKIV